MMADHKSVTRMLKTARGQIDGILIESGDEDLKAAKLAEIERVVDKLSK
ncbi:MAG: hypothetical protein KH008_03890 [Collinsella sp.]|nr:hypothetical protein [Collinsella sp.]